MWSFGRTLPGMSNGDAIPGQAGALPGWLADQHRRLAVDEELDPSTVASIRSMTNRIGHLHDDDLLVGAGFAEHLGPVQRIESLPDIVGASMTTLVVGLNPSPASAETGVAFARPGNRFWPAVLASGLASVDRDPTRALADHGLGFTDIVKRTTRTAAEITSDEFTAGIERLERLTTWLRPAAVMMVGLMGWRAALDRKAVAGWQDRSLGPSPVYLMPSTSGLNAHSSLADLTAHMSAIAAASCEPVTHGTTSRAPLRRGDDRPQHG